MAFETIYFISLNMPIFENIFQGLYISINIKTVKYWK